MVFVSAAAVGAAGVPVKVGEATKATVPDASGKVIVRSPVGSVAVIVVS